MCLALEGVQAGATGRLGGGTFQVITGHSPTNMPVLAGLASANKTFPLILLCFSKDKDK